jgi:hypothetical protein
MVNPLSHQVFNRHLESNPDIRRSMSYSQRRTRYVLKSQEEKTMTQTDRIKYLRIALVAVGLAFIFGIWALSILWPSGWSWHEGRSYYFEMILAVYATLGIFLVLAARNPLAHKSLIAFTVWSSVAHGAVMAVQSFQGEHHMGHLTGDVATLFAVAAVLGVLTPWQAK